MKKRYLLVNTFVLLTSLAFAQSSDFQLIFGNPIHPDKTSSGVRTGEVSTSNPDGHLITGTTNLISSSAPCGPSNFDLQSYVSVTNYSSGLTVFNNGYQFKTVSSSCPDLNAVSKKVIELDNGNFCIVGNTNETPSGAINMNDNDILVSVIDYNGNLIWARKVALNNSNNDVAMAVCEDPSTNELYVAAYTNTSMPISNNKFCVLKFSPGGILTGLFMYEPYNVLQGERETVPYDIMVYNSDIYVVGESYGNIGTATHQGHSNAFLAKIDPTTLMLTFFSLYSPVTLGENAGFRSIDLDGSNSQLLIGGFGEALAMNCFDFWVCWIDPTTGSIVRQTIEESGWNATVSQRRNVIHDVRYLSTSCGGAQYIAIGEETTMTGTTRNMNIIEFNNSRTSSNLYKYLKTGTYGRSVGLNTGRCEASFFCGTDQFMLPSGTVKEDNLYIINRDLVNPLNCKLVNDTPSGHDYLVNSMDNQSIDQTSLAYTVTDLGVEIINHEELNICESSFRSNTSLKEIQRTNSIEISPNPAHQKISISQAGNYEIYSYDGKLMTKGYTNAGNIDIEMLKGGIYLIKVTDASGNTKTGRFVKN